MDQGQWLEACTHFDSGGVAIVKIVRAGPPIELVVERLLARLEPELEQIAWRLFLIESRVNQGALTLADFLSLRTEIRRVRSLVEDLPLVDSPRSIMGGDVGTQIGS